jgi:hypothetical protein
MLSPDPEDGLMMRLCRGPLAQLTVAAILLGFATWTAAAQRVQADPARFSEQRAEIERELASGHDYHEIDDADRQRVLAALERMGRLLDGRRSVKELSPNQTVELINNQELVNTVLSAAAEDSRQVCTREKTTGTRLAVRVCRSVAEIRRQRQDSREYVEALSTQGRHKGGD